MPFAQWFPWETELSEEIRDRITLVYAGIEWKYLEPEPGIYDFDRINEIFHLDRLKQQGYRIVLRILADFPSADGAASIPDWLYEAIGQEGTRYDSGFGKGFSPNYDHPALQQAHGRMLKAFAEHYGQDFVAFIQMGTVGHFGEWNTAAGGEMPSPQTMELLTRQYQDAFPGTPLLFRRPFPVSVEAGAGYYNDMLGTAESTDPWLDWILLGDDYTGTPPIPRFWQIGPVGGEFSFGDPYTPLEEENYGESLRQIRDSHMTFIGPCMPFQPQSEEQMARALEIEQLLGYDVYLAGAEYPEHLVRGENRIRLEFRNKGIAPLFTTLPVTVTLHNARGEAAARFSRDVDFSHLSSEAPMVFDFSFTLDRDFEAGVYDVRFSVADPMTGLPFPFSNAAEQDGSMSIFSADYVGRYSPYTLLKMRIQASSAD